MTIACRTILLPASLGDGLIVFKVGMSDFLRRNLDFFLGRHEFAAKRFGEDALVELLGLAGAFLQVGSRLPANATSSPAPGRTQKPSDSSAQTARSHNRYKARQKNAQC
jgi:hypothetical protein